MQTLESFTRTDKRQISSTKLQISTRLQIPNKVNFPKSQFRSLEIWSLEFIWDLEFGYWNLRPAALPSIQDFLLIQYRAISSAVANHTRGNFLM
jgi:hypothetical protein